MAFPARAEGRPTLKSLGEGSKICSCLFLPWYTSSIEVRELSMPVLSISNCTAIWKSWRCTSFGIVLGAAITMGHDAFEYKIVTSVVCRQDCTPSASLIARLAGGIMKYSAVRDRVFPLIARDSTSSLSSHTRLVFVLSRQNATALMIFPTGVSRRDLRRRNRLLALCVARLAPGHAAHQQTRRCRFLPGAFWSVW